MADGAVYKGDLRTGHGEVISDGAEGRLVVGLSFDRRSGLLRGVGINDGSGAAMVFDGSTAETPSPSATASCSTGSGSTWSRTS